MDKKFITLPTGGKLQYDPSYTIDDIMDGVIGALKYMDDGSSFNKDRGGSMADRAISGGDVPEAIAATLKKNHGWVQPVFYQEKINPNKPSNLRVGGGIASRPEFADVMPDMPEAYPGASPGPGTETKIAYILYDNEKKEFYRFNPPGFELGSIAHAARATIETVGDIGGEILMNKAPFLRPLAGANKAKRGIDVAKGMTGRSAGAGIGGGAMRGAYDLGLEQLGVREDPRSSKDKLSALAGTTAVHGVGNLAGEGALRGVSGAGRKLLRGKMSPDDLRTGVQETALVTGGKEIGTPSGIMSGSVLTAGTHRGGGFYRSIEGMLHKSPLGNTTLGDKILRTADGIDKQISRILGIGPKTGPLGEVAVGKQVQEGIIGKPVSKHGKSRKYREGGFMGEFEAWQEEVFKPLKANLSPQAIDVSGVRAWKTKIESAVTSPADNAVMAKSGIRGSLDKLLLKKNPTYGDVEMVRRRVGSLMADALENGNSNSYKLYNGLYKRLKRSQELTPNGHPLMGPTLQKQHDAIDGRFYDTMELIKNRLKKIKEATDSQTPYRYVAGLVKSGKADMVEDVMDTLHSSSPDAYEHFVQRYVYNLGRRKDGMGNMSDSFEITVFLNQTKQAWTEESRNMLFKYMPNAQYELENLIRVIHHRFPEYSSKVNPLFTQGALPFANTNALAVGGGALGFAAGSSQSSQQGGMDPWTIALYTIGGAALGTGAQHYGAKLLANANFAKWLANGLESGKGTMVRDISKLTAIASSSEDIETKVAIGKYLEEFTKNMAQARGMALQREKSMKELGMSDFEPNTVNPNLLGIRGE